MRTATLRRILARAGFAFLAITTPSAAASADRPSSLVAARAGFSWVMQQRYNGADRNRDGLADYFTPPNYEPFRRARGYDPIDPASWRVNLRAHECPSDGAVRWLVDGRMAGAGCNAHVFLDEAPHAVSVVSNGAISKPQVVMPKDWLIAVIGDSYGSGEGNPDVPFVRRRFGRDNPSRWEDKQCHRTAKAGAPQAAAKIERANAHSSVTLLHLSCSGATIQNALLGVYAGARPDARKNSPKRPQVKELQGLLGDRTPDALLISVGGNDVGFANIVRQCLLELGRLAGPRRRGCYRPTSKASKTFEAGIKKLPERFDRLADALKPIGIEPSHVLLTGYPDATRHDDGGICGDGKRPHLLDDAPLVPSLREISGKEARWASETVLARLNGLLRSVAAAHGWKFVGDHIGPSRRHGECAKASWFISWKQAKVSQESFRVGGVRMSPGVLHPNALGHRAYRDAMLRALRSIGIPSR